MKHPITQMTLHKHIHGINYFKWKHKNYLFSCSSGWKVRNKSYYCSVYFFTGNRQWQTYSSSTHEIRDTVFIANQNQMLEGLKTFTEIITYVCLWKQRKFTESCTWLRKRQVTKAIHSRKNICHTDHFIYSS